MVNNLIEKDVPTHIGTFTGKLLLNSSSPILDGLTHWWDAEGQSGGTWVPKIGNVNLNVNGTWKNGLYYKSRENICESALFDVDFSKGFAIDILLNLPKYNDIPYPGSSNVDTQLVGITNELAEEYLLHYTSVLVSSGRYHFSAFYSPTLLNGLSFADKESFPLNQWVSDVFTWNGSTAGAGYLNAEKTVSASTVRELPTQIKLALHRILPGGVTNNNLEGMIKSIRIYNRHLSQEEIANNRAFDLKVLGELP